MDLGSRLIRLGVDVRFWSQNAFADLPEPFASRTLSVLSIDSADNDPNIVAHVMAGRCIYPLWNGEAWGDWKPDAAIILSDYTAARMFVGQHLEAFASVPTFHYCPIEGIDLPPEWKAMWETLRPVAMSHFGAEQIEKIVGYRPPMIYHGVDTDTFHPLSEKRPIYLQGKDKPLKVTNRAQCRQMWSAYIGAPRIPKFWMLRTDRHMPRKRYNAMIRAVTPVMFRNAGTLLMLNARPFDQGGYLPDSISKIPGVRQMHYPSALEEEKRPMCYALFGRDYPQIVITMASGMDRPSLVSLYNAADLYLSTSAEGFGLTIAEALACGTPAVGVRYSAVPEVIGPAGLCVAEGRTYDNEYDHRWWEIDEAAYGKAVESMILRPERLSKFAKAGPAHIKASFSWDKAALAFRDLVQESTWQPSSAPVRSATT